MLRKILLGVLAVLAAGCGDVEPCARIAAVRPGQWVAIDRSECEDSHDRSLVWLGGPSGVELLGVQDAAPGEGPCTIVRGGPSRDAREAGPWCLSLHVEGLAEDAVCVPEDTPAAVLLGSDLVLVQTATAWVALLPEVEPACDLTPAIGG